MKLSSVFAASFFSLAYSSAPDDDDTPLPLIIWHGLGDSFNNPHIQTLAEIADDVHPGTFTYVIQLDSSPDTDRRDTFFGNLTDQIENVCQQLASHPILSTAPAVDAIGFSQGGQFLRGYVERCNSPPVRSLVTFGSQHLGIVDLKACGQYDFLCKGAMTLFRNNAWGAWVQGNVVPAQYYRDPQQMDQYLDHSNFLADINNERDLKNQTYVDNIAKLENMVMVMFADDTTVIPKESSWFEEVNDTVITPLRASMMYKEDWLGLRALDRKGGLKFREAPGDHMQFTDEYVADVMKEFFGPMKSKMIEALPAVEFDIDLKDDVSFEIDLEGSAGKEWVTGAPAQDRTARVDRPQDQKPVEMEDDL